MYEQGMHIRSVVVSTGCYTPVGGFSLVFLVKGGRGQKFALKRMAVNDEQDLYNARQEIAITVR